VENKTFATQLKNGKNAKMPRVAGSFNRIDMRQKQKDKMMPKSSKPGQEQRAKEK
jgi:hypothetical protein